MSYPSDLSEKKWNIIKVAFESKSQRGRPPEHFKRTIVNAILYVVKSGCQWRMLPNDLPCWQTVYDHFSRWNKNGIWEKVLDKLNRMRRQEIDRTPMPSYAIIDAQSVKTQYASEDRGIDGGKKVKGHLCPFSGYKRHILVDIMGNLLHAEVHAANISDTKAACNVMTRGVEKYPTIEAFSGDAGYCGTAVLFAKEVLGLPLHISKRIKDGWAVLPKRWVVERTFSWLNNFRRLSKDFEKLTATAENMIRIAMIKIMLAKFAK